MLSSLRHVRWLILGTIPEKIGKKDIDGTVAFCKQA
jgi:hypothetical protein